GNLVSPVCPLLSVCAALTVCLRSRRAKPGSAHGSASALPPSLASMFVAQTLQRTPLYDRHVTAGARMVPFAGWEMPVQYDGVIPEHKAVRSDCGVFDVSHMGELEVEGMHAPTLLQAALSNDLAKLEVG